MAAMLLWISVVAEIPRQLCEPCRWYICNISNPLDVPSALNSWQDAVEGDGAQSDEWLQNRCGGPQPSQRNVQARPAPIRCMRAILLKQNQLLGRSMMGANGLSLNTEPK